MGCSSRIEPYLKEDIQNSINCRSVGVKLGKVNYEIQFQFKLSFVLLTLAKNQSVPFLNKPICICTSIFSQYMHKNSLSLAVMIFLYNNNKCELCHITTLYANLLLDGWQEVSHNAKVEIYDKSSSSTHTQIPLKEICLQIKEICNSMKQEFCDKLKVMAEISYGQMSI